MVTDLFWVCGEAFSREVHKNLHFCIFDLRSKIDATRECQSELYIPLAAPIFAFAFFVFVMDRKKRNIIGRKFGRVGKSTYLCRQLNCLSLI